MDKNIAVVIAGKKIVCYFSPPQLSAPLILIAPYHAYSAISSI